MKGLVRPAAVHPLHHSRHRSQPGGVTGPTTPPARPPWRPRQRCQAAGRAIPAAKPGTSPAAVSLRRRLEQCPQSFTWILTDLIQLRPDSFLVSHANFASALECACARLTSDRKGVASPQGLDPLRLSAA